MSTASRSINIVVVGSPITALTTKARAKTAGRVINLYDLMDSAYNAPEIKAKSRALGHVPLIDPHPRGVPGCKDAIAAEARGRRIAGYALAEGSRWTGPLRSDDASGIVRPSEGDLEKSAPLVSRPEIARE